MQLRHGSPCAANISQRPQIIVDEVTLAIGTTSNHKSISTKNIFSSFYDSVKSPCSLSQGRCGNSQGRIGDGGGLSADMSHNPSLGIQNHCPCHATTHAHVKLFMQGNSQVSLMKQGHPLLTVRWEYNDPVPPK